MQQASHAKSGCASSRQRLFELPCCCVMVALTLLLATVSGGKRPRQTTGCWAARSCHTRARVSGSCVAPPAAPVPQSCSRQPPPTSHSRVGLNKVLGLVLGIVPLPQFRANALRMPECVGSACVSSSKWPNTSSAGFPCHQHVSEMRCLHDGGPQGPQRGHVGAERWRVPKFVREAEAGPDGQRTLNSHQQCRAVN